jgi:hypothetical protein
VDHAVRRPGAAAQAFEVVECAAVGLDPGGDERCGGLIRSRQAADLMTGANQLADNG